MNLQINEINLFQARKEKKKHKKRMRKLETLDVNLHFCKEEKKSQEASHNKKNKEEIEKNWTTPKTTVFGIKSRKRKTRSN